MHLLATSSASLDEAAEPVDLDLPPTDLIVLSFSGSDLQALAAVGEPRLGLLNLRELRHPMSVDLWIDKTACHARLIVVRLLGGVEWWRYGLERLRDEARRAGFALAVLPGEDRDDPNLAEFSTAETARLLGYFRAGGAANMAALVQEMARLAGLSDLVPPDPQPLPSFGWHRRPEGAQAVAIFYRSTLLAGDVEPLEALEAALATRGIVLAAAYVPSLKDPEALAFLKAELGAPEIVLTLTAFGAGDLDWLPKGAALMQIVNATTRLDAWATNARGLAASDLAMHVVLPEIDGRVLGGVISFKEEGASRSMSGQVAMAADRIAALIRLRRTPAADRRMLLVLPDYPGAVGREAYAVGLDVPGSVLAILSDLGVPAPGDARELMERLKLGEADFPVAEYRVWFDTLPQAVRDAVTGAWGEVPGGDFRFRAIRCGTCWIALPPDRGDSRDRRAAYHDPALPPSHALLAFSAWMRRFDPHALVHLGAHGTFEWLPGKAVALTPDCFPTLITGSLPVVYPFIVTNPGEAAQAKRRIAAVTLGHLPPQLSDGSLTGPAAALERLVDEYAQADGLDPRRRDRLASLILEAARDAGLAAEAGVDAETDSGQALAKIDAWLCDIKDMALQEGLHVYGRSTEHPESAASERRSLSDALSGRFVPAGPAGAPARGRRDVFPTGRNLYTADPRQLPTQTAMDLAKKAVSEVIRLHIQEQGEAPRSMVIDLWGSATLRTGGEEIAQGLALLGCRPLWDAATGRVTGVEVLPPAVLEFPRVDVTFRISGLFRDLFPSQIALLDAAVKAVAARDESAADNPLAEVRARGGSLARVFGAAPGRYGAGIEDLLNEWDAPLAEVADAYLETASYAYGGAEGQADHRPGEFAIQVAGADLLLHGADDPYRDLLQGTGDAAHVGGFAAAQRVEGLAGRVVVLDTSDPARPRPRLLEAALARIIRGRATHPRHIDGLMRHGPRGAAEMAEAVDRLADFARLSGAVDSRLFDLLFDAYVADPKVRDFLKDQNPDAARAIADRLAWARQAGLWQPRRNDLSPLEMLR
ncbi:cobaltochelatase subunit CobN [Lacibacterium aquatile]|uniref:Cobaltochelatase subunit CobN n=1 Tax=Lacibacterium aquatile TaxID=1168082 RepID=A0ABW5DTC5_9PROT